MADERISYQKTLGQRAPGIRALRTPAEDLGPVSPSNIPTEITVGSITDPNAVWQRLRGTEVVANRYPTVINGAPKVAPPNYNARPADRH